LTTLPHYPSHRLEDGKHWKTLENIGNHWETLEKDIREIYWEYIGKNTLEKYKSLSGIFSS
jgi:hypothetical protein